MAGVDSAGLGEVLQNVLASFSLSDRGLLVQVLTSIPPFSSPPLFPTRSCYLPTYHTRRDTERVPNGYAGADARALGPPPCDAATDPPARDATPDRVRGGPVPGCMAWNGRIRADGRICARWRDQGRVRGVGRRARTPVVGRKLECERGLTGVVVSSGPRKSKGIVGMIVSMT